MSFSTYFRIASYGMLLSGFLSLALTGRTDLGALLVYGATITVTWFIRPQNLRISKRLLNLCVLFYMLFYLVDYFVLSRDFRLTSIHLLFFVAMLKLVTLRSDRDYFYLFVISFLQLLAATTLTVSILFLVPLFLFLISSISTLVLFEMKHTSRLVRTNSQTVSQKVQNHGENEELDQMYYFSAAPLLFVSVLLSFAITALAIPIFFTIPRLSVGLFAQPTDKSQMISGFSERVKLGEIGSIKQNPTVVMRIKVRGVDQLPEDIKWSGVTLGKYDGRSWFRSDMRRTVVRNDLPTHPQGSRFNQRYYKVSDRGYGKVLEQTIYLEPLSTEAIFAAQRVLGISADWPDLLKDSAGSLSLPRPPVSRTRYTAYSEISGPNQQTLRQSSGAVPQHLTRYLELPESVDPRISQLAHQITKTQSNPYDKAVRLERFLKTNYTYSLDLKADGGTDPIADFLFTTKAGHCEYFASSMAVMLRQLGVPTRLVNGFRRGEYNELGQDYIVRQSDAHSWVQAYFPNYGWVDFDPTPPDPLLARNKARKFISNVFDAVEMFWAEQVINYDLWKQLRFLREAKSVLNEFETSVTRLNKRIVNGIRVNMGKVSAPELSWTKSKALFLPLSVLLVGLAALFALRRRPWLLGLSVSGRQTVALSFYVQTLDLLSSRGIVKPPDVTPREFAQQLSGRREAAHLSVITDLYNKARYSGEMISDEELKQITECLKELKESLKRK